MSQEIEIIASVDGPSTAGYKVLDWPIWTSLRNLLAWLVPRWRDATAEEVYLRGRVSELQVIVDSLKNEVDIVRHELAVGAVQRKGLMDCVAAHEAHWEKFAKIQVLEVQIEAMKLTR